MATDVALPRGESNLPASPRERSLAPYVDDRGETEGAQFNVGT